jgi:hypothetical protein
VTSCHGSATALAKTISFTLALCRRRVAAEPELETDSSDRVVRETVGYGLSDELVGVVTCGARTGGRSKFTFESDTQVGDVSAVGHAVQSCPK